MPEQLFHVETQLPFAWALTPEEQDTDAMRLGARLLLNAINQMETVPGHPDRSEPGMERLEAKLDLMLHWLGQSLYAGPPLPQAIEVRLDAEGIVWSSGNLPDIGETLILSLYLHPALAGPLQLPARVTDSDAGKVRVEFIEMDETLRDLWSQWLFCRHRRAIHAAREGG